MGSTVFRDCRVFMVYHYFRMALVSTQPLTETSTRRIPGSKDGRCVRLTTLPPSWAIVT